MKIGILADTHDNIRTIRRAIDALAARGAQAIIHAGDVVAPFAAKALKAFGGAVYAVYGNNDGERPGLAKVLDIVPPPRQIDLGGRRIVLAHEARQIPEGLARAADLIVTGHTHELAIARGTPLQVNPGEAGGWVTGRATCVVLDLYTLEEETCDLAGP